MGRARSFPRKMSELMKLYRSEYSDDPWMDRVFTALDQVEQALKMVRERNRSKDGPSPGAERQAVLTRLRTANFKKAMAARKKQVELEAKRKKAAGRSSKVVRSLVETMDVDQELRKEHRAIAREAFDEESALVYEECRQRKIEREYEKSGGRYLSAEALRRSTAAIEG